MKHGQFLNNTFLYINGASFNHKQANKRMPMALTTKRNQFVGGEAAVSGGAAGTRWAHLSWLLWSGFWLLSLLLVLLCVRHWDIQYPRSMKASRKLTKGTTFSYDRTSFRSPIGSGRKIRNKQSRQVFKIVSRSASIRCSPKWAKDTTMHETH